jgi:acyl-CoA synthetase (AMP-forming)/AMP-acid ligase II
MPYIEEKPLSSVGDVMRAAALLAPESPAIVAHRRDDRRQPLSYRALDEFVSRFVTSLNAAGIGRGDRVAIVLPNGPEMALAFLGVAAGATAAPLNPTYRASELEFYLTDLGARAVMVPAGSSASPAFTVSRALGIPILEVVPAAGAPTGIFELRGSSSAAARSDGYAEARDVALVLHTSGSTARPKLVPLTHANVCASAHNVARTLELSSADRCMNVMPLFHIHGLVAALLASLAAHATVACTEGFDAPRFFETMDDLEPTWYTAVPTMHRAILDRAEANRDTIARHPLRFIRSSSSALAPQLMRDLEAAFGAPVIEAYGMTEAAHQVASNPLPPSERRPGSVGLAAGPEIAVMDGEGNLLPPNASGEIVIRGANVTTGYEKNPEANANAFTNGWFRTGDRGRLNGAGYLVIEGRVKEIINRGGEKISPREIDEVLLDHPAVAQAVAFAIPDPKLGEDVAAAIVLGAGASATERELRSFVASRLADFKVPRRVVFVSEIPKGPTGKLQRIGLAATLGLTIDVPAASKAEYAPPASPAEIQIAELWARVLRVENPGVHDDFFESGGDSILAAQLLARIREVTGLDVEIVSFFETPTIAGLADELSGAGDQPSDLERLLAEVEDLSEEEALRLLAGEGET